MDPKSRPKSIKSVFRRGLKKNTFLVPFWDRLGDKIVEIGVQMSSKKSAENKHPNSVILGSILGTIWEWACGAIALKTES